MNSKQCISEKLFFTFMILTYIVTTLLILFINEVFFQLIKMWLYSIFTR